MHRTSSTSAIQFFGFSFAFLKRLVTKLRGSAPARPSVGPAYPVEITARIGNELFTVCELKLPVTNPILAFETVGRSGL